MKSKLAKLFSSVFLTAGVASAVMTAPAQGAIVACPSSISGLVSGTDACQRSTTFNQDSVNPNDPLTVNLEGGFFGFTDWAFGGKIGETAGYTGTKQGQSGTWNISGAVQSNWSDVMLLFKSGNNTYLTGYNVTDSITSGIWSTPFDKKDVSHISVYYRPKSTEPRVTVPEPATIIGLGLVVGGMVMVRRRKVSC
ncbi:MAG TPA: PEP-CTERM sorting domain-containing protein [Nostocaceae cyanobacterium]|nr:PEP-CTERM sorting domain-containing protein [Nostocaceae cyanobacterium]